MADNLSYKVPVSGTLANIATDDVSGNHYQYVKLVDGTLNGTTKVGATAHGLKVDLQSFPTEHIDAFSRIRTSNPAYRFDAQFTYAIGSDVWDTKVTGTGVAAAHDATERCATVALTAGTGLSVLQSHYNPPYTPGRSHLALITFNLGATPGTGVTQRVGLLDEVNSYGIYLERTASGVTANIMGGTTAGNESVAQASWNIDPMNGNGISGINVDWTTTHILVINFQALYVGDVILGLDINGEIYPVHQFNHANTNTYPYIQQASLPVHYSVRSTSAAGTLAAICASVISEGGEPIQSMDGRHFSTNQGVTALTAASRLAALTIRSKAQINSINQNAIVIPLEVGIVAKTNDCLVEIVRNGTLGGTPSWSDVNATSSTVEKDTSATTVTGGTVIASFYAIAGSAADRASTEKGIGGKVLLCYSHLLGAGDTLSVVVTPFTGSTVVNASLTWKELR